MTLVSNYLKAEFYSKPKIAKTVSKNWLTFSRWQNLKTHFGLNFRCLFDLNMEKSFFFKLAFLALHILLVVVGGSAKSKKKVRFFSRYL